MGILGQIDIELQKDLLDFVKAQEEKPYPHVLRDSLLAMALREIIDGNARISGWAKNDSKKTVYIELTFWENEESEAGEADHADDPQPVP